MKGHKCFLLFVFAFILPASAPFLHGEIELVPVQRTILRLKDAVTEIPIEVSVSGFLVGKTEVTQEQFLDVMGYNPSFYRGQQRPVENVTWWEAIRFCNLLSSREGFRPGYDLDTGEFDFSTDGFRLPTETEWVVASGLAGEEQTLLRQRAKLGPEETSDTSVIVERVDLGTSDVARLRPNRRGLYDVLGNVWEWCHDFFNPVTPAPSSFDDPSGPVWGPERVIRGGSFLTMPGRFNQEFRSSLRATRKSRYTGFRVCRRPHDSNSPTSGYLTQQELELLGQAPDEIGTSKGVLSPLLDGVEMGSLEVWEAKRTEIVRKWEKIVRVPEIPRSSIQVQTVKSFEEDEFLGRLLYLEMEPGASEKVLLMLPRIPIRTPTPVVIVPYYDVDAPVGKNLGGRSFRPPGVRSFAYMAVREGFIAVAVRWFGESYGEHYNEAVATLKLKYPEATGMGKSISDIRRVLDFLETLPAVDLERIGIIGHSLGAKLSLYAAAFDERIKVTVFSEGGIGLDFSNYEDYWYLDEETVRNMDSGTDHHELLGLIAPRPFLLIAGDSADKAESWHYINAARPVYEVFQCSAHLGMFNHHSGHSPTPESVHLAMNWLKQHLRVLPRK